MPNQINGLYEFGHFRVDVAKRLLSRAGEPVTLAPKTFDLLLLLVQSNGRVLTKSEFINSLWPDTFVEEASLSYQIATLRKALGDEGERWIETMPKYGYRFAATVNKVAEDVRGLAELGAQKHELLADAKVSTKVDRRLLVASVVAALAILAAFGFAVLYFAQMRQVAPRQDPVRFVVLPPEGIGVGDRALPAVSPDGQRLVFEGLEPDGQRRLWLRPLSSLTAEPVLGSEGAVSLFWSPDSRSIGFFADGKLKRSDLNGVPPQNLCDASDALRPIGTWSRDGVILFNSFDRRGLFRVAATGGEPSPVTTFDASRQDILHAWPQFLPDGRHFIYLVQSERPENNAIYVDSLDSKKSKRLLSTTSKPTYAEVSGRGYLFFMKRATLMAQRFDTTRLEVQGEALPIAEEIWMPPAPAEGFGAFSVSMNGVLCYRTLGRATTELVWFDRQGNRIGTVGEPGNYSVPALSPDEKTLAITRIDPQIGTRDLWLFDLARGMPSRFTFDLTEETNPTWSPDGNRIAFSSDRKGHTDIYQKVVSGTGDADMLLESTDLKIIESWSPDGRFIFYHSIGKDWELPLEGDRRPVELHTSGISNIPEISPNMKWEAYQSNESGRMEIYVQSFPPSGAKWQVTTAGGEEPYWRKDGKELFYVAGKTIMAVDVNTDGQGFRFGIPQPLFEARLQAESLRSRYQVAAKGQRFLVSVPLVSALSAPITVVTNWMVGLKR
jgi:Tol biopolymer transport system component/DNA-binding winged helix-turn-helix (wHTH) protein